MGIKLNKFTTRAEKELNAAPTSTGRSRPKATLPISVQKIAETVGLPSEGKVTPAGLTKMLKAVESLLLITRDQIAELKGSGKTITVKADVVEVAPRTPRTPRTPKAPVIEQFVAPTPALKKVYREAGIAETKEAFRAGMAKAKPFGVSINHFNKMITVAGVELLIYGTVVRGGICKFICKNAKGKDVRVDVSEVLAA